MPEIARATTRWDGVAGAYPNYGSSGTVGYIPELWSAKLVENLYPSSVFGSIANTDYEGEISNVGDTVNIRTVPHVAISDYVVGGGLTYEVPQSDKVQLEIDSAKAFSFQVNSIDKAQSDIQLIDKFTAGAAEDLKAAIDKDCFTKISADVAPENKGPNAGRDSGNINLGGAGAPVVIDNTNILQYIVLLGQVLDEQDLPDVGRWLVLPPWACTRALLSDLKDASITGDGSSVLRNGRLGVIDRFTIYRSRHLPTATETGGDATRIFAGHPMRLTWASNVIENETLPNPSDFGSLVRGLTAYGVKVLGGGDGIAELYAQPGALV